MENSDDREEGKPSLTIKYMNILKIYGGPDSAEAKAFRERHQHDKEFAARTRVLDRVYENPSQQRS